MAVSARLACMAVSDPCFPPFRLPKKPKFLNPYGRGHAPPLKTLTHARNGTCSPPSQSGFAPLIGIPSREGVCRIFHCECRISSAMVIPEAVPRPVFDTMPFSVIQYGGARSWPIEVNLSRYSLRSKATGEASVCPRLIDLVVRIVGAAIALGIYRARALPFSSKR
jgi:hypothetical protein